MVKNAGGNKAKGFARKHVNGAKDNELRISKEDGEIYAVVTNMCGGNMFQCYGIDGIERLCHIRGSFSGRKKRDNIVEKGGWVLVGIREWDNKPDDQPQSTNSKTKKVKLPQCDLLEVYSDGDKNRLRDSAKLNWKTLVSHDPTKIGDDPFDENDYDNEFDDADGFKFVTANDIEREKLLKEAQSATSEKIRMIDTDVVSNEEMVSFEDL
jgi:translation initiation factor IF-1